MSATCLCIVTSEIRVDEEQRERGPAPASSHPESVWYIFAMGRKVLAAFAILSAIVQISVQVNAQATTHKTPASGKGTISTGANSKTPAAASPAVAAPSATQGTSPSADSSMFPLEDQQPHVVVTVPTPAPSPPNILDRITWGANLVLVVLGYVGIMLALSTLKKIERGSRSVALVAAAAADSAQAALLNAKAIMDAGRPWLLVSILPSPDVENSFAVMATNRGRSPARIVGTAEQVIFAVDETHLARIPEYSSEELTPPLVPIILMPGESVEIKPFSRTDLKSICDSEERLRSIESWEEKVYIYGKIMYRDLTAPPDNPANETDWCCWYIHGRQKSGLVFAGPPDYNMHT